MSESLKRKEMSTAWKNSSEDNPIWDMIYKFILSTEKITPEDEAEFDRLLEESRMVDLL